MKKIILFCIFALSAASSCLALSNQTESLTIATYYPSPYGVYRNLKLEPTDDVPSDSSLSPGVMYYNNSSDMIKYYNKTRAWVNLTGGGGGGGGGNETWWKETSAHHIYNSNAGFVGIGTNPPQAPLTVMLTNSLKTNPVVARFVKHVNGVSPDQYLSFYLWPPNAQTAYLDSTSVVYACASPPETLELAAGSETSSIRFNVGNFTDSYSEVMRLVNRNGSHSTLFPADPRVGIGTTNPLFTLHVETKKEMTTPLMVRGLAVDERTGMFTMTPYANTAYLAYGCYLQNGWFNDPYKFVEYPSMLLRTSYDGAKLSFPADLWCRGAIWNHYSQAGVLPSGKIGTWDAPAQQLWDAAGNWVGGICPPSSRKLKENFVKINPDDILEKIDQLQVSRWNYKSEDRSVTHIGPVAEDFNRLFKTGSQEDQLHLIDSVGVSLAGVKAVLGKVNAQQQKIEEFRGEIQDLRTQLSK